LNKQGRVFIQQQQLSKAETALTDAVKLSQQVHDYYQQAESLIALIKVYKRQEQQEKAEQVLQAAESVCHQYNYNYLLGLACEAVGDFDLEREAYQEAFRYYGKACRFMALYNAIRYSKFLRKLNDALLQIPETQIAQVTQLLITYWQSQELKQDFPELIALCEEVRGLMAI
jgi:tetratricopeptide (TPR) repeat protein